jgi:hypothetical protein
MGVSAILSTVCSILKRKNSSHIKRNVSVAKKYFSAKNIPMAIGKKSNHGYRKKEQPYRKKE